MEHALTRLSTALNEIRMCLIEAAKEELGPFYDEYCAVIRGDSEHGHFVRFYTSESCFYMHRDKRTVFEAQGPGYLVANKDHFESRWDLLMSLRYSMPGVLEAKLGEDDSYRQHHIKMCSSERSQFLIKDRKDLELDPNIETLNLQIIATVLNADLSIEIEGEVDQIPNMVGNTGTFNDDDKSITTSTPKRYSRPRSMVASEVGEVSTSLMPSRTTAVKLDAGDTFDEATKKAMDAKRYRIVKKIKFKKAMNTHDLLAKDQWDAADVYDEEERGECDYESDDSGFEEGNDVDIRTSMTSLSFRESKAQGSREDGELFVQLSGKSDASEESDRGSFSLGVNPLHGRARALSRHRQKLLEQNSRHRAQDSSDTYDKL